MWLFLMLCACNSDGGLTQVADDSSHGPGQEHLGFRPQPEYRPLFVMPPGELPDPVPIEDAASFLYEEGVIHDFRIELDGSARAHLALDPRDDVHATFEYEGERWEVGLHLKGSWSFRTLAAKAAFKIDFHEWVPEQSFRGVRRLTLNNMVQDATMMREHAAYRLYAMRGLPAPRHGYARVWVDGTYYGLYGIVESMDQDFLDRAFPAEEQGNLYEGSISDFDGSSASRFDLKEEGLYTPFQDLQDLMDRVGGTSDDDVLELLEEEFATHAAIGALAVDLAASNVDGYTWMRNNFLAYHAYPSGDWYLVPWGQDQAMAWNRDVSGPGSMQGWLSATCFGDEACRVRLEGELRDVLDVWENGELYDYITATRELVAGECAKDPRHELPCQPDGVLRFIVDRPRDIRDDLRSH